jgi:hypothetical protein
MNLDEFAQRRFVALLEPRDQLRVVGLRVSS